MKRTILILSGLALVATIVYIAVLPQDNNQQQTAYEQYVAEKTAKKLAGQAKVDEPEMRAIIERERRTHLGDEGPNYGPNQVVEEFLKAKKNSQRSNAARLQNEFDFVERGPANVGGRTRALLIDPDDPTFQTWYAGAASGGIWKTSDGGTNWTFLSMDIPNMGTNTLAMSVANTDVIYAGTGEHFTNDIDGAGMFKSTDKGNTWTQIADPSVMPDFKNVSRIVVDPNDENVVIATTRSSVWGYYSSAIYKTTDGGVNWTQLRSSTSERYDDLDYDPTDFNTLYVAIDGKGVIKSTDGGVTWSNASSGLSPDGRVEITVSPVNSGRLWASVEGSLSGSGSDLYVSSDGATSWNLVVNESGNNPDFLGGQGWYDNIITAHPFDEDIVYVGGVNLWKFKLTGGATQTFLTVSVNEVGTDEFMSFVSFGGAYVGGTLDIGSVPEADLYSVEVRFGQGTQKAHRFTVGGAGPQVPTSSYIYRDYVEVPFQVWDVTNNRQLMVSFRDQQEDGKWNLIAQNTTSTVTADHSREYVFIHDITYSTTADPGLSVNGGQEVDQLYFYWPVLTNGGSFNESALPVSTLKINVNETSSMSRSTTSVSDAYGQFGGPNAFPQQTRELGIHPDQHNLVIYDVDQTNQAFRMLVGNDGGVYTSIQSIDPGVTNGDFEFVAYGYNTTQYYGADKAPGENRFIGGMQDNGTWYHPSGTEGSSQAFSEFALGGDGFEALWHSSDINKIIGGSQFNGLGRTLNGGSSWENATSGLPTGSGQGPFVTRLAHHKQQPERIFAVASSGVYRSTNFGGTWSAATMNEPSRWSFNNSADVEVSYASPNVVWAGGSLDSNRRLYVSLDGGSNFDPVNNYSEIDMGFVSGIGTHPTDVNTAYALFSFAEFPKVLKTTDLGQTWTDISGFDGSGSASTRGFPDVAVNCLFVFPNDPDRIWVGSEIGIIESLDNGQSWGLLEANLPPVNVSDIKMVEDQLVIATYGRGIWSVKLDNIVIAPYLSEGYTTPSGKWQLGVDFSSNFDSTFIYVGETEVGRVDANEIGFTSLTVDPVGLSGELDVNTLAFKEGRSYPSIVQKLLLFSTKEQTEAYANNFNGITDDFLGEGFQIKNLGGFSSKAIHTDHPYPNQTTASFYLRVPILVSPELPLLRFKDVAIIEPGESGSVFGEEAFFDYVVVEGSSDGKNWEPLQPGYDSRINDSWLSAYDGDADGSNKLFKNQEIDLTETFEPGEVVLIRFRYYSDQLANAWGWVIDDLYIQQDPLAVAEKIESGFEVFPNPIEESATLSFELQNIPNEIKVIDLQGRIVETITNPDQQESLEWTPSANLKGLYMLQYESEDGIAAFKVVIE